MKPVLNYTFIISQVLCDLSPLNMAFILSVMMIILLNSEQGAGEEEYKCGRCLIGNEGSIKKQRL